MKEALHKKIKKYILRKIKTGELKPGEQIPTEKELVEKFNTSRTTVRKALDELTVENYIYRKRKIGSFVNEDIKNSKNIGLILSYISDYLSGETMVGIEQVLREHGYTPIVEFMNENIELNKKKVKELLKRDLKGLIAIPRMEFFDIEDFSDLLESDFPLVYMDRAVGYTDKIVVQSENYQSTYELTQNLIKFGNSKNIAFISYDEVVLSTVRDRLMGIRDATKRFGAKTGYYIIKENQLENIADKLIEYDYDTIFCCYDTIAVALISIMQSKGYKIPDDIKIVGFDDRKIGELIVPKLTSIKQNFEEMGIKSAQILIDLINKKNIIESEIYIPTQIIYRESCGIKDKIK
jgi:DNA-binding LacI/PurR family transcriptional regulator